MLRSGSSVGSTNRTTKVPMRGGFAALCDRIDTHLRGALSGRVLLVDDLVDSGVTLEQVQSHLRTNFPAVTEVKSAVIWCKACSSVRPDFHLQYLETNPWIHQPFEEYDGLRPHQLAAWMKKGESN